MNDSRAHQDIIPFDHGQEQAQRADASEVRGLTSFMRFVLPGLDLLCLLVAARLASLLIAALPGTVGEAAMFWNHWERWAFAPAMLAPLMLREQLLEQRTVALLRRFLLRFALLAAVILLVGQVSGSLLEIPSLWLGLWLSLALLFTLLTRLLLSQPLEPEVIAVIGAGPATRQLLDRLQSRRDRKINVLGVFDDRVTARGDGQVERSGTVADLVELGKHRAIDWVLLALPGQAEDRVGHLVHDLKALSVPVGLCLAGTGAPLDRFEVVAGRLPVALLADRPLSRTDSLVKALEDHLLGGLITLALLPLMGLIALAIKLESPGPVLFRQRRHAWNNAEFDVLKFRTMRWQPDAAAAPLVQTERDDPRITPLGRLLRRTSLDELPQLFNVMRGEMSLVGPRPHAVNMRTEERLGHEIIAAYAHRHRVKPGLTGWAQVNGSRGATTTTAQLRRRVELDLEYIERWSLWLDLSILLRTIAIVLRGTNAY